MTIVKPVILSGGSGTRLWPISTSNCPKQFVDFPKAGVYGNTLFKYALKRIKENSYYRIDKPLIVAAQQFQQFIENNLKLENIEAEVIYEPIPRNTAASLTLASLFSIESKQDPIFVVLPSDQAIDDKTLNAAVTQAVSVCEGGGIVLLGVQPTYPETGYGYIKSKLSVNGNRECIADVLYFREKPSLEIAKKYLEEGDNLWNSGIFILKPSSWLKAIEKTRPDILEKCIKCMKEKRKTKSGIYFSEEYFKNIPEESIDYAVIERCKEKDIPLKVIPFSGHWTDLGSWQSIYSAVPKSSDNNFKLGESVLHKTTNSMVISTHRPVVVNGLSDVCVVETRDAVLVTDMHQTQDVKKIVSLLSSKTLDKTHASSIGYRPWGRYCVIDEGPGYKVKKIDVRPHSSLSLQLHHRRSEQWVVVRGIATVQKGNQVIILGPGDTVHIAKEEVHRLTNASDSEVSVIETQTGEYLGEDDIERLEDAYGRI